MKKQSNFKFYYEAHPNNFIINEFYDNLISQKYYQSNKATLECSTTLFQNINLDDQGQVLNGVMKEIYQSNDDYQQKQLNNQLKNISIAHTTYQYKKYDNKLDNNHQKIDNQKIIIKDQRLIAIFQNTKSNKLNKIIHQQKQIKQNKQDLLSIKNIYKIPPNQTPFNFNKKIQLTYPHTPHFKNKLQSPFWKFNSDHKHMIELLKTNMNLNYQNNQPSSNKNEQIISIDPHISPINYLNDGVKYFLGIALKCKQLGLMAQSRIFYKLGCYIDPYNDKPWRKFIQFQQQNGCIYKAFILSKTAFLFTLHQDFAKNYIINGDKCGIKSNDMCGLLLTVNQPQYYQKTLLIELAKIQLKGSNIGIWKGLKILSQVCYWNQYKLPVCSIIIYLAKLLENYGHHQKALQLLKRSFSKNMSKLQIYTTYIQIKMRNDNGQTSQEILKQILLGYSQYVSGQNRYKLYLELAQIYYKRGDSKYKKYVLQAYDNAKKYCASGTGCNKTLRFIYFTIAKWKGIDPIFKDISHQNDQIIFQRNRYRFIEGMPLHQYQFIDWKYYLHYGLQKKTDLLFKGIEKWPLTGRLVSQWIHSLRAKGSKHIVQILAIWRKKIQEVPKSGQLWCQGGRIYAQLQQYSNASKCFRSAIHFTPQYGDSFIQELRILLLSCRFQQIERLKQILFVSQPFYGHVWSYLKLNHKENYRLSLNQMWENAIAIIKEDLYKKNVWNYLKPSSQRFTVNWDNQFYFTKNDINNPSVMLTGYPPYNQAFLNPSNQIIRNKLFTSYEQMENKN